MARAWDIRAWTYDADLHCTDCAEARFTPEALADGTAVDSEGNEVHPVFETYEANPAGEYCADCGECVSEPDPSSQNWELQDDE